jgi:hypothetical protein
MVTGLCILFRIQLFTALSCDLKRAVKDVSPDAEKSEDLREETINALIPVLF